MNRLWQDASDLSELPRHIDAALSAEKHWSDADRWRLIGMRRAAAALFAARSFADRGVLLRELVRLNDGRLDVPLAGTGIAVSDVAGLPRFGLGAQIAAGGRLRVLILDDPTGPTADSISRLWTALRLDAEPRRAYQPTLPDAVLLRLTPHNRYRTPTQKAAVRALLCMPPASALSVTMPTGSGKSLLFQIGVRWWRESEPGACALVVVPTIALAHDHARTLSSIPGLEGSRAYTGELGFQERADLLDAFVRGEVPILLLSPELALGRAAEHLLIAARPADRKPLAAKGRLTGLFIDEAHIVDDWGRSFRPDFQRLPSLVDELREANRELRVVLLSATLGDQARKELRRAYGQGSPMLEVDAQAPRYELDILSMPQPTAQARDDLVLHLIDRIPRPAILYTTEVAHAKTLHRRLRDEKGYRRLALFTGEISDSAERRRIVDDWSADRLDLIVATSAFGLGIDKPNVRAVIHACVPHSPARWYQEIGRAARDGFQGLALCIWHREPGGGYRARDDRNFAFRQATGQWMKVDMALKRWRVLLAEKPGQRWDQGHLLLDLDLDAIHADIDETSDCNQRWNMAVLNALQRKGSIAIRAVHGEDATPSRWRIRVIDHRILEEGAAADVHLGSLLASREEEIAAARGLLNKLLAILEGRTDDCALVTLFAAVETGNPSVDCCGRCAWCRDASAPIPTEIEFKGLASFWQEPAPWTRCRLTPGIAVIQPADPDYESGLPVLLGRLARVGVEQFAVPTGLGEATARSLAVLPVAAGLVLEHHSLLDGSGWHMANLPTALLLREHGESVDALYRRCADWCAAHPGQPLLLIAAPGIMLNGRPLEQIASTLAPYPEVALDEWKSEHAASTL